MSKEVSEKTHKDHQRSKISNHTNDCKELLKGEIETRSSLDLFQSIISCDLSHLYLKIRRN